MNEEMITKAKEAKSVEELIALAKKTALNWMKRVRKHILTGYTQKREKFPMMSLKMYPVADAIPVTGAW